MIHQFLVPFGVSALWSLALARESHLHEDEPDKNTPISDVKFFRCAGRSGVSAAFEAGGCVVVAACPICVVSDLERGTQTDGSFVSRCLLGSVSAVQAARLL
ncbi:hypothetical protein FN846DRAFT_948343 [Sphaerosporella brunnea]|uniref:Secreted protein n=1 Tax=Sphaerosporella brunnea TaxID=1250544 RepID=A0A5J5EXX9_9PEZI|nr:hypothetical protein FN846DRAFT_713016 [Sphaerosporella brunnea]KAA8906673.1 hypothetical protein FN846DRAFT_948343 [Sphaerosporella brunnea]